LWNETSLQEILRNEVYIGNLVHGKVGTVSYKNSTIIRKQQDEWIRAENTHEPIIDRELWDRVQSLSKKRHKPRKDKDGETTLYSGLLVCADCGFKLRGTIQRGKYLNGNEYKRYYYNCGNYARSGKTACTIHSISEYALNALVTEHIRSHAQIVEQDEERIIEAIITAQSNESISYRAAYQSEIASHEKQVAKLDVLIENLYADRVSGVVPPDMFKRYIAKYEGERVERLQSVETLKQRITSIKQNTDNAATWTKLIKPFSKLETVDYQTLVLLIDKIIIGEVEQIGKERVRDVKIVFNYVGDLSNLHLQTSEVSRSAETKLLAYASEVAANE
jgi:hypothetical protein